MSRATCTAKKVLNKQLTEGTHLADNPSAEMTTNDVFGSTDVADVQQIAPGVFFQMPAWNTGASAHSWQATASSGADFGYKGMLYAGEVMATATIKLLEDQSIIAAAKQEFLQKKEGKTYVCPIDETVEIPQNT